MKKEIYRSNEIVSIFIEITNCQSRSKCTNSKSFQKVFNRHVWQDYLDFAEEYAKRHVPLTMSDWAKHLDLILQANGSDLLQNAGKITAALAKQHAENEFEKYRPIQDRLFESDFDKEIKRIEGKLDKSDE